jgi:lipoate-protein ligase A
MTAETLDTIVLLRPGAPYFSVGHHQVPERVLDLKFCRRTGFPVFRRRIGGGTVYLDRNQLFYQVIVHRSRAPFRVGEIYRTFLQAPVMALRAMGLDSSLEGVNEVVVGGRRIAGTGGGQIGDAVVVTGNILYDFDYEAMALAWRVPSAPFRRLAAEGLSRYITTLRRELHQVPPMEKMAGRLAEAYAETLGRPLHPGVLTPAEEDAIARAGRDLFSESWTEEAPPGGLDGGLKIARGIYVRESEWITGAGPVRVTLRLRHDAIDDMTLDGTAWRPVSEALRGVPLREEPIFERLRAADPDSSPDRVRDLVSAILAVAGTTPRI